MKKKIIVAVVVVVVILAAIAITGKYRHTKSFIISMRFLPGILQRCIACLRDIGDLHPLCPLICT